MTPLLEVPSLVQVVHQIDAADHAADDRLGRGLPVRPVALLRRGDQGKVRGVKQGRQLPQRSLGTDGKKLFVQALFTSVAGADTATEHLGGQVPLGHYANHAPG